MKIVLFIISVSWIALGAFLILYTVHTREFLKKVFFRDHRRWFAVFPFVFGLILMAGAFYQREMFWLAFILGVLAIIKGVYLAIGSLTRIKAIQDWWYQRAGDGTIRLFGLITFILGCAVLSYVI